MHLGFGNTCIIPCFPNPLDNTLPLSSFTAQISAHEIVSTVLNKQVLQWFEVISHPHPHFSYFAAFISRRKISCLAPQNRDPRKLLWLHAVGMLESSVIDPCLQLTCVFDLAHPVERSPKRCVYLWCYSPQIYHKLINFTCPGACHKHFAQ